jgi:SAM-dependent methyltransferase
MSATALVCPACRAHAAPAPLEPGHDAFRCPRCGARFPVTVAPIVGHPAAALVRAVADAHVDLATTARIAPWLADDAPSARVLQRHSVAVRAHWGDRLGEPAAWAAFAPFLRELPLGDLVELGCGAGRVALELATPGRRVVALDTDPALLACAAAIRDTGEFPAYLRELGTTYRPALVRAPELRGRPVELVLADALDPPLAAGAFDAVVALNLLDNVRVPSTLLGQIDALLRPGGTALLSTPYAWDSGQVDDGERIGGAAGRAFGGRAEEELRRVLEGESLGAPWRFELVREERHVPWTLVRDERCRFQYDLHVVVVRKRG